MKQAKSAMVLVRRPRSRRSLMRARAPTATMTFATTNRPKWSAVAISILTSGNYAMSRHILNTCHVPQDSMKLRPVQYTLHDGRISARDKKKNIVIRGASTQWPSNEHANGNEVWRPTCTVSNIWSQRDYTSTLAFEDDLRGCSP